MAEKANIGLIGLGVMGENLVLNMDRHGYKVAVYNRSVDKVDQFLQGMAKGTKVQGFKDEKRFIESLEVPRKVVLLVKAGDPVDATIAKIKPYLDKGDIIIDGGNSFYLDTRRRERELSEQGFFFIGSGVSGGEEGALWGPSLMPGGDKNAYEQIRPIWEDISAKAEGEPCCTYLGPEGAGHFVKMVHNGIEYGDMQLIAETYDFLRKGFKMTAYEIADVFENFNKGNLNSFLIEITAQILTCEDPDTKRPLVDVILDKAGQKGTGKWTAEAAQELGVPIPTIDAALTARLMSAMKEERVVASEHLSGPNGEIKEDKKRMIEALADALFASKICSYAQGLALIHTASVQYGWGVDIAKCAAIWRGGCIIRSTMLNDISRAFQEKPELPNLLVNPTFSDMLNKAQANWRKVVANAQLSGIPVPAFSASLAYFDSYRNASLPQNLTQAQRDFFGAHTYQRSDKPEVGFVHTDWHKLLRTKAEQR